MSLSSAVGQTDPGQLIQLAFPNGLFEQNISLLSHQVQLFLLTSISAVTGAVHCTAVSNSEAGFTHLLTKILFIL